VPFILVRSGIIRAARLLLWVFFAFCTPFEASALSKSETAKPGQSARPYALGQFALVKGDMRLALKQLSLALAQQTEDPVLQARVFQLAIATGDFAQALPLARKIAQREPGNAFATYVLIGDNIRSSDWAKVTSLAQSLTNVGSDAFLGPLLQAWSLQAQGKGVLAQEIFSQLGQRGPFQVLAREHQVYLSIQQGDFAKAINLFTTLSARRQALAVRLVGAAAYAEQQQGRLEAARALLEQGRENLRPASLANGLVRLSKGQPLDFEINSPRDAVALGFLNAATQAMPSPLFPIQVMYAQLAVWLSPQRAEGWIVLAQFLQAINQEQAGVTALDNVNFDGALRLDAELMRATLLEQQGASERAIALLAALGDQMPERADVWIALGDVRRRVGLYQKAAENYSRALNLLKPYEAADARIFFARGIAHQRSNEKAKAEADLQAALKLRADDADILNYIGYTWIEEGRNLGQALEMINKALAIRPDSGHIRDSQGWAFFHLGQYQLAIEALEAALARLPGDADVNEHLGDAYWQVGRTLEARYRWQAALDALDLEDLTVQESRKARLMRKIELDPAELGQITPSKSTP
jgi:tetratricopeptide (TPR) repeat protein